MKLSVELIVSVGAMVKFGELLHESTLRPMILNLFLLNFKFFGKCCCTKL